MRRLVDKLLAFDYVTGVFVDDAYGPMPGTLPLSAIGMTWREPRATARHRRGVQHFYLNPDDLQTGVQVSDTDAAGRPGHARRLRPRQTFNNMAAMGPDFKAHVVDSAPVGNADIAPTLAQVLGFSMPSAGTLTGRVIAEALAGGTASTAASPWQYQRSAAAHGRQTLLIYQTRDGVRYLHAACAVDAGTQDSPMACR